jgi:hypothetical protein
MSEQEKQPEVQKSEVQEPGLRDLLMKDKKAPVQSEIEKWKALYGDVYVSGFSEEELYIFRSVKRSEWVKLQEKAQVEQLNQFQFEELLCNLCVLWKSVDVSWENGKAGAPSALQEQILQHSNFLTPQAASLLVAKL